MLFLLEEIGLLSEVFEIYDGGKFGELFGRISGFLGIGFNLIFGFRMMGLCFLKVCFLLEGFGFCFL